ncbi:MAG TPA: PAS domain-containing protein, partial [Candidatus Thermoplasmatota archaeon]|nr:PAS domain-containing protein [Candidatus Thermoplasmatota archaeon]
MLWPTVLALALAAGALLLHARERRGRLRAIADAQEAGRRHDEDLLRAQRERQAALDRLDAAERRLARVTDAAPDAMLLASSGRVERANPAAARLLGAPAEDLAGLAVRDLAHGGHAVQHGGHRVAVDETRAEWTEGGEAWSVVWLRERRAAPAPPQPSTRLARMGLASLDAAERLRAPLASLRMSATLANDELRAALGRPEGRLAAAVMTALSHEETLMTDLDRLERIAKTLDEATRAPDGTPGAIDVNALAEDVLARAPLPGGVRVHKELLASARQDVLGQRVHVD